jgi:hypothetical protein
MAEIECTVALPKRPINWFQPVRQSRQQVLRSYCSNTYIVFVTEESMRWGIEEDTYIPLFFQSTKGSLKHKVSLNFDLDAAAHFNFSLCVGNVILGTPSPTFLPINLLKVRNF